MKFTVIDDSGFLAIIDPDAYEGFVAPDWELPQIMNKLRSQMAKHCLLIWGTGASDIWNIAVRPMTRFTGHRHTIGSIVSTQGRLLITNYESLTMVASFPDVMLPQHHEIDQLLEIVPGNYECRIIQLLDPKGYDIERDHTDFIIELRATDLFHSPWNKIPWWED
jgi:hypothetical protein